MTLDNLINELMELRTKVEGDTVVYTNGEYGANNSVELTSDMIEYNIAALTVDEDTSSYIGNNTKVINIGDY